MIVAAVLVIAFPMALAQPLNTWVTATSDDGMSVPVDVTLDHTSMLTVPGKPAGQPSCYRETVNLHDFKRRLVAMKSVDKHVCLVMGTHDSFDRFKPLIEGNRSVDKKLVMGGVIKSVVPEHKVVQPQDVKKEMGEKIADFCNGYSVRWMQGSHAENSTDEIRVKSIRWCIFCVVHTSSMVQVGKESVSQAGKYLLGQIDAGKTIVGHVAGALLSTGEIKPVSEE